MREKLLIVIGILAFGGFLALGSNITGNVVANPEGDGFFGFLVDFFGFGESEDSYVVDVLMPSITEYMSFEEGESFTVRLGYPEDSWNKIYEIGEDEIGQYLIIEEDSQIAFTYLCEKDICDSELLTPYLLNEFGEEISKLDCERTLVSGDLLECITDTSGLPLNGEISFTVTDNSTNETKKKLNYILRYRTGTMKIDIDKDPETGEKVTWCKCTELIVHDMGTSRVGGGLSHEFIVEATVTGNLLECSSGQEVESTKETKLGGNVVLMHLVTDKDGEVIGWSRKGPHGVGSGNPAKDDYTKKAMGCAIDVGGKKSTTRVGMMPSKDGNTIVWVDIPGFSTSADLEAEKKDGTTWVLDHFTSWVKDSDGTQNAACKESFYILIDLENDKTSLTKNNPKAKKS